MSKEIKKAVIKALKTHLKANFAPAQQRLFVVTSKAQYLFTTSYKTPGIAIIYRGGPNNPQKGGGGLYTIKTEVWVFQTIWNEGKVVDNESEAYAEMGLLQMEDILTELLEANLLEAEMPEGLEITNATVANSLGTDDFPEIGSKHFSGCIGIGVEYKVLT